MIAKPKLFVYQDESGEPGKKKFFIIGVLVLNERTRQDVLNTVSNVRSKHNFYEEIHFKVISSRRFPVYKDLMTSISILPIHFSAMIIDNAVLDLSYFSNKRYIAYNRFAYLAIYHNIKSRIGNVYVYTDDRSRIKEDNFLDYLKNQLEFDALMYNRKYTVKTVEPRDSKQEELLQVTDLYLGAVNAALNPPQNCYKCHLASLMNGLVQSKPQRFNLWHWKPKND